MKIKPMTKRDLLKYFKDYRAAFPDWIVRHDVMLVRSQGLIEQHIIFYALRSGDYRPASSICVSGPNYGFQLLYSFLDIKNRQVSPRDHEIKFSKVLKAMEEQFQPSIRKPLDIREVILLAEKDVAEGKAGNIQYCAGLATLNAYDGNSERALFWCSQIEEKLKAHGHEPADWELQGAEFAKHLAGAIRSGKERAYLHAVTDNQPL